MTPATVRRPQLRRSKPASAVKPPLGSIASTNSGSAIGRLTPTACNTVPESTPRRTLALA